MNDKFKHLVAGAIIALIVGAVLHNIIYGLIASMLAGIAKEVWDYSGHGVSDFGDILATIEGGLIGVFLLLLLR